MSESRPLDQGAAQDEDPGQPLDLSSVSEENQPTTKSQKSNSTVNVYKIFRESEGAPSLPPSSPALSVRSTPSRPQDYFLNSTDPAIHGNNQDVTDIGNIFSETNLLDGETVRQSIVDLTQGTPKRKRSEEESSPNSLSRNQAHKKSCAATGGDPHTPSRSQQQTASSAGGYASAAKNHVAFIVPLNNSAVSPTQAEHIRDSLINLLYSNNSNEPAPAQFVQYGLTRLTFKVTCANQRSLDWILQQTDNIPPLGSTRFKVVRQNQLPKIHCMSTYFPRKTSKNLPTIKQRLVRSNPQLDIDSWLVYWSLDKTTGVQVCYGIPEHQYKLLQACNFKLFFELSCVDFTPCRYYQGPPGYRRPPPAAAGPVPHHPPPPPQRQSPNRDPTPAEAALSSGATGYGPAHNTNQRHPTNMPLTGYSSDPNHCGTKPKTTQPKKQTGGGHKPRHSNPTQSFNQRHGTINRPPPPVTAQIRSPPRSLMSLTFHRPPTPSTTQAAPTHQATLEQPPPTETGELPNTSDKQNNM